MSHMRDLTTIITQWRDGAEIWANAIQDLIDLIGGHSWTSSLDQIPDKLIWGIIVELDRRPHTEGEWKQLREKDFFHIGGGPPVPPRRLSADELSKMHATTEAARTRMAGIDIGKVRSLFERSDYYQRHKVIEDAQNSWGGNARECPKCGYSFRSVGDRGQCPKCCRVFFASHPDGDENWWRKEAEQSDEREPE